MSIIRVVMSPSPAPATTTRSTSSPTARSTPALIPMPPTRPSNSIAKLTASGTGHAAPPARHRRRKASDLIITVPTASTGRPSPRTTATFTSPASVGPVIAYRQPRRRRDQRRSPAPVTAHIQNSKSSFTARTIAGPARSRRSRRRRHHLRHQWSLSSCKGTSLVAPISSTSAATSSSTQAAPTSRSPASMAQPTSPTTISRPTRLWAPSSSPPAIATSRLRPPHRRHQHHQSQWQGRPDQRSANRQCHRRKPQWRGKPYTLPDQATFHVIDAETSRTPTSRTTSPSPLTEKWQPQNGDRHDRQRHVNHQDHHHAGRCCRSSAPTSLQLAPLHSSAAALRFGRRRCAERCERSSAGGKASRRLRLRREAKQATDDSQARCRPGYRCGEAPGTGSCNGKPR